MADVVVDGLRTTKDHGILGRDDKFYITPLRLQYNITMKATLQLFLVLSATTGSHAFVHPRVSMAASKLDVTSTRTSDAWVQQGIEEASPQKSKEGCVIGPSRVLIYDTTLRDGTQGESVSASCGMCS